MGVVYLYRIRRLLGFGRSKLDVASNWSSLSSIGNSHIAKLTILMPIIGYLILFNENVVDLLRTVIPLNGFQADKGILEYLHSKALYFLYFGLLIFGVGVALYNINVPRQIKKFPYVEDYIVSMEGIGTSNLIIGSFNNVLRMYFQNNDAESQSSMFDADSIGFPSDARDDLHRIIEEIFRNMDVDDDTDWPAEDRLGSRFFTGSGYIMTDAIMEVILSGRRIDQAFRYQAYAEAEERSKDIFYIEHKALEYTSPKTRLVILFLYILGMLMTVCPTIIVSLIIIESI